MASINGITLKKLKDYTDHEGFTIHQADVYFNNKRLGVWSEDTMSGEGVYDFDQSILIDLAVDYIKCLSELDKKKSVLLSPGFQYMCLDALLSDLVQLMENEQDYKRAVKRGFKSLVVIVAESRITAYVSKYANPVEETPEIHDHFLRKATYRENGACVLPQDVSVNCYNSLECFNIKTEKYENCF